MRTFFVALALAVACVSAAQAMFALVPADRVNEVPIERLLANIERNAQGLTPAQQARAIGRLHLLAYLRQSDKLTVYRERPGDIAEGVIGDCATMDKQSPGYGNPSRRWPKPMRGELCEARTFSLGPRHEVPYQEDKPLPATAHLMAAIAAYGRAKTLEPDNLRTRLALAFAFDRAGRIDEARDELRFVLRKGLELIPLNDEPGRPKTEWETHVVLSEAVGHFTLIAARDDDKRLIEELRHRLELAPPLIYVTPIFVPLERDASLAAMIDRKSKVAFDFSGQGGKVQMGWLTSKAAWLVWDPRGTGKIKSGFQMFGSVTWISFWENGYLPLGALDDDGDGKISGAELNGLALWQDTNENGVSDAGEVKPLAEYDIVALGYAYERQGDDMWVSAAGVTFADGETRPTYDWRLSEPSFRAVAQ